MVKKNFKRLIAILLCLAPLAFAAACSQADNSASGNDPSDIVEEQPDEKPSEDVPEEGDNLDEGDASEEENTTPDEGDASEDDTNSDQGDASEDGDASDGETTKPSLPGGLVDGGNFTGH